VLAISHVLHFLLSVQWLYALENVGPYRVLEIEYLSRGFWSSLGHHGQTAKYLIVPALDFYSRLGRLVLPIVLWMIFVARVRQSDRHSDRPRAPMTDASRRHLLA
jgi:nicotinamide riboside transporter PnuC